MVLVAAVLPIAARYGHVFVTRLVLWPRQPFMRFGANQLEMVGAWVWLINSKTHPAKAKSQIRISQAHGLEI